MEREWKVVRLDHLYDFSSGLSKPRSAFGSGHPFLSFKDVFYSIFVPKELSERVNSTQRERQYGSVKRGDVFLTRTSEIMDELGMSCVALRDVPEATFNGFTKRLRPKVPDAILPEYAGYLFRSPTFRRDITAMSSLSTRASLNNEMLARLTVAIPPVEDQARIAQTLICLDDRIELNRRMSETLEAMARALFQSWFVDFDHTESSNAPPPMKWARGALLDISKLNPESWSARTRPELIAYVDLSGVKWGRIGAPTIYTGDAPSRAQRVLRPGDTIVGTVRPGNGSYAIVHDEGLTGSTGFAVLRPLRPEYRGFVYLAATAPENIDRLAHLADGGAYPAVRPDVVAMTEVVIPPADVMLEFGRLVNPLLDRVAVAAAESRTLGSIRDVLLPKLISGELRVPDAERIAVEAGA